MKYNYKIVEEKLIEFLKNETQRIGIQKAVIGLSGGIDSAVSTYLTVKALGKENVLSVLMPYKASSKESITDAQSVVKELGVRSKVIEITDMVDSFITKLSDKEMSGIRKGNIMARVRMIVLYDESAKEKALVIGTGNKTEILLGYTTLFGDSACAINPLGSLYKTQVFDLARHLGVPKQIIEKKPSADLWAGQTDEGEMGLIYAEVDKYLYNKIDENKSQEELLKLGYSIEYMNKVDNMMSKNRFKSLPPTIAKL
ncbi:MAG: NAD+ synthase [Ignavibacteriae bacterium]|nr:NAD+ synthase [Ignavibacteriota bacterium]